jgi:MFS family permease
MSGSGGTAGGVPGVDGVPGARDRRARLVVTAFYLVQGMCFAGLLAQVPTLQHDLGISDGTLTLILLLVPVVAGVGSVLAGALAPRTGSARLLHVCGPLVALAVLGAGLAPSVGGVVGAVGLAAVTLAPGPWVAVVGFGLTGLGLSVVVPLAFSVAGRLDPDGTGVAVARVNLFNYVGFVVGAGLIGGVAEVLTLRLAFAVPALLALGVIALAPAFRVPAEDTTADRRSARSPGAW